MTKEEFALITAGLKAVYTKPDFIPDNHAMDVWFRLLEDMPYTLAEQAAQKYMATKPFPPTPADIRTAAADIMGAAQTGGELTVAEAFAMYWDALCDSGYNAQARFDALPEIIQRVAGSPSSMHDAAISEGTNQSVERALFEKRFTIERERMKEELKLPASVRELISQIGTSGAKMIEEVVA